jgi:hypothetical protein
MELARSLRAFIDELPPEQLLELKGLLEARLWREVLAVTMLATTLSTPPPTEGALLSTHAAAAYLDTSEYELRDRVRRGEVRAIQGKTGARYHFEVSALEEYKVQHGTRPRAPGARHRYTPPDDPPRGAAVSPPTRLDPAPARRRPKRHRNDGRALGTGHPRRNAARRDEPYAPGLAAWSGPTPPAPKKG